MEKLSKVAARTEDAFFDELMKIAVPKLWRAPGMLSHQGIAGISVNPLRAAVNEPQFPGISKRDAIIMADPAEYAPHMERVARRHEVAHHVRRKAGKMQGVGDPGLRNVLRTGREEAVAYLTSMKRAPAAVAKEYSKHVVPGVISSLRTAYPQGIGKAMLGGTLGKALQLVPGVKKVI